MPLQFDLSLAEGYKSGPQRIRKLSEAWVGAHIGCPRCGAGRLEHFRNNKPAADFFCPACANQYELKSMKNSLADKVNDGAYESLAQRISSDTNPDFFFLSYLESCYTINSMIIVPKYFFTPAVIKKRNPLPQRAKRAGWIGAIILLGLIPEQGRVSIVKDGIMKSPQEIMTALKRASAFAISPENRGWLFDTLNCVNQITEMEFSLSELYKFEDSLQRLHPENSNIRAKLRQQLQLLRDRGVIEFLGRGNYRKLLPERSERL